jgi:hypothetical protein
MKLKKNIIAIRIKSLGLGNIFFQYATAKSLAIKKNAEVVLDISGLKMGAQMPYSDISAQVRDILELIEPFNMTYKFIEKNKIFSLRGLPYSNNKVLRKLGSLLTKLEMRPKTYVIEKEIHQFQDLAQNTDSMYLDGTFINPNYFLNNKKDILKDFSCSRKLPDIFCDLQAQIRLENSISIHIRRGDYLSTQVDNVYVTHDIDYVENSIKVMESIVGIGKYYIFSDDIDWVKSNMPCTIDATYVSSLGTSPWMDLELMSLCHHNIICNSTFSWWGAFRNKNPEKIVICPKAWRNDNIDISNMILDDWIAI